AFEPTDRKPAVLADVLTERRAANLPVRTRGEGPIVRPVVLDNLGPLAHTPSLRRAQRSGCVTKVAPGAQTRRWRLIRSQRRRMQEPPGFAHGDHRSVPRRSPWFRPGGSIV